MEIYTYVNKSKSDRRPLTPLPRLQLPSVSRTHPTLPEQGPALGCPCIWHSTTRAGNFTRTNSADPQRFQSQAWRLSKSSLPVQRSAALATVGLSKRARAAAGRSVDVVILTDHQRPCSSIAYVQVVSESLIRYGEWGSLSELLWQCYGNRSRVPALAPNSPSSTLR
jgi:hypothetical protein